jgi:hypothetical protein
MTDTLSRQIERLEKQLEYYIDSWKAQRAENEQYRKQLGLVPVSDWEIEAGEVKLVPNDDLVKRLREGGYTAQEVRDIRNEAADALSELRAENERLVSHSKLDAIALARLREALEGLLECTDWTPSPGGAVERARAALSQSEGDDKPLPPLKLRYPGDDK